jgi:hypothetical protein
MESTVTAFLKLGLVVGSCAQQSHKSLAYLGSVSGCSAGRSPALMRRSTCWRQHVQREMMLQCAVVVVVVAAVASLLLLLLLLLLRACVCVRACA